MPGIVGPLTRQCVSIAKFQLLELDRAGQIYFSHPIFRARNFTWALDRAHEKMGLQNQSAPPIKKQLETFCPLLLK